MAFLYLREIANFIVLYPLATLLNGPNFHLLDASKSFKMVKSKR